MVVNFWNLIDSDTHRCFRTKTTKQYLIITFNEKPISIHKQNCILFTICMQFEPPTLYPSRDIFR